MEIKNNLELRLHSFPLSPQAKAEPMFNGVLSKPVKSVGKNADSFVRRPIATKSAIGLLSLKENAKKALGAVDEYFKSYKHNIKHTYEHKLVFALVEKEQFHKNSIDSITHDLDKLILYILGFPRSFVSKFHRKHSEHHPESGKNINLRSAFCDNVAHERIFNDKCRFTVREHYNNNKDLQNINGFGDILEQYHYGEDLDLKKINTQKELILTKAKRTLLFVQAISSAILLPLKHI